MARYLIEVSQPMDALAYRRIRNAADGMGSHFVSRAVWRRVGGFCTGNLALHAEDRAEALSVVPPNMRPYARALEAETALAA